MMSRSRLESFSDGVFSIILTVMVLQLTISTTSGWNGILNSSWIARFIAYVISFTLVTSFWISHHNIVGNVQKVSSLLLWHNAIVLFPISMIPIMTAWFGSFPNATPPSFAYALDYVLTMAALYSFSWVVSKQTENPLRQKQMRRVNKNRLGFIALGAVAMVVTLVWPPITWVLVFVVSVLWFAETVRHSLQRSKEQP